MTHYIEKILYQQPVWEEAPNPYINVKVLTLKTQEWLCDNKRKYLIYPSTIKDFNVIIQGTN